MTKKIHLEVCSGTLLKLLSLKNNQRLKVIFYDKGKKVIKQFTAEKIE